MTDNELQLEQERCIFTQSIQYQVSQLIATNTKYNPRQFTAVMHLSQLVNPWLCGPYFTFITYGSFSTNPAEPYLPPAWKKGI